MTTATIETIENRTRTARNAATRAGGSGLFTGYRDILESLAAGQDGNKVIEALAFHSDNDSEISHYAQIFIAKNSETSSEILMSLASLITDYRHREDAGEMVAHFILRNQNATAEIRKVVRSRY